MPHTFRGSRAYVLVYYGRAPRCHHHNHHSAGVDHKKITTWPIIGQRKWGVSYSIFALPRATRLEMSRDASAPDLGKRKSAGADSIMELLYRDFLMDNTHLYRYLIIIWELLHKVLPTNNT
jgi:hypothetical protein